MSFRVTSGVPRLGSRTASLVTAGVLSIAVMLGSVAPVGATKGCNPGPGAYLEKCNFTGANLAGKNLRVADLTGAILTGANLTGANLTGASMTKTTSPRPSSPTPRSPASCRARSSACRRRCRRTGSS